MWRIHVLQPFIMMLVHLIAVTPSCLMHTVEHADMQSEMSESRSEVVEVHEVATKDMEVIIKFIYGRLNAIPEEQLQSLLLACDRLQVRRSHNQIYKYTFHAA